VLTSVEPLQQAIRKALDSGYQLGPDALQLLKTVENPDTLIDTVLTTLETSPEKPLVLTAAMFEAASAKTLPPIEEAPRPLTSKATGRVMALEVEPEIEIIQDPTGSIGTKCEAEDFLAYFQDRYKRLRSIFMKERSDSIGSSPIRDLAKGKKSEEVRVIGMVQDKIERSPKLTELVIEDQTGTLKVLITSQKPDLRRRVGNITLDEVLCVVGKLRGDALFADNIFWPDVPKNKLIRKSETDVSALLISDIHVGSRYFLREAFKSFLSWLRGELGNEKQRAEAGRVKYLLVGGDVVDGIGVFPDHEKELLILDLRKQYEIAAEYLSQVPSHIEIIIIPGNHDASRSALPAPAIFKEFAEPLYELPNVHMLGDPSIFRLHGVEFLMTHGTTLEDYFMSLPGVVRTEPQKAMIELLRKRHLAPTYGARTPISPERRDYMVIEQIPDVFQTGHVHMWGAEEYRGVWVVNSSCWQGKTKLQAMLGVEPKPGIATIYNLKAGTFARRDFLPQVEETPAAS
jgi:DNA polymerase II small subunit